MRVLQRMAAAGTAVALSLLCSCGGEHQKVPESQPARTDVPTSQPTATGVSESPNVTVESGNKGSYAEAYCEVLRYLLDQYGYVHSLSPNEGWLYMYEGLEYAGLADLEQDGIPELICGYLNYTSSEQTDGYTEHRVAVFRYDRGVVRELLNAPCDARLDNWSDWGREYLYLKTDGEQPFLILPDCQYAGDSYAGYVERASVFTLENGILQCHTGIGLAHGMSDGEYGDWCYVYTACQVDGKTVPVDEYVRFIDSHTQEARAIWTPSLDATENQASLQSFLDGLTDQAGAEKIDLADYAEATKQWKTAPYEGEPYVLGNVREEAAKLAPLTPTDDVLKEYQAAERTLLTELVTQYWQPGFDRFTMNVGSFGYEKVDFENDGLPEIIVSARKDEHTIILDVLHYSDGAFQQILHLEKDAVEGFGFLAWQCQYFALKDWREDDRGRGHLICYLLQNGEFVCTDFSNGTINGEAVSPEVYEAEMGSYDHGIADYFLYCEEDKLRSLAANLGMSPEEIDQLLGASK